MEYSMKYNELSAEEFILLWETVWGQAPSLEQTRLAMEHTLFRVSVYDGDTIIAMARMIGDMGLDYYIKDVIVRPEYQGKGVGRMLINELLNLSMIMESQVLRFLLNYVQCRIKFHFMKNLDFMRMKHSV